MPKIKVVLVSSCAPTGVIGRFIYGTHKQLKLTAQTIGTNIVSTLFAGLTSKKTHPESPKHLQLKIRTLAGKLANTQSNTQLRMEFDKHGRRNQETTAKYRSPPQMGHRTFICDIGNAAC